MKLYKVDFKKVRKHFVFFLDIKKAYDTVWRDGLWYRMWDMGIQGKLWRVIRNIYNVNRSCVILNGCKSDYFDIYQGVAQGCTLSSTIFLIFINGLMKEIERTVPSLPSLELNGLLFVDDFVGLSNSEQGLQALIDVVYAYIVRNGALKQMLLNVLLLSLEMRRN